MSKPRRLTFPPGIAGGLLMGIFFLSGAAGLTYEVIWLRQLNLIFGVTSFALAIVLAAFMAGLALGSYLFGRIADRTRAPLMLYAALELGIGLYALLIPLLFGGLDHLYILAGRALGYHSGVLDLFRSLGAFLIILVPTVMMGGTLPVVCKSFVRRNEELGLRVGLLYGINTLGATVGTFLTGFFLIRSLGMQNTICLAAAVNGVVALAAWGLSRSMPAPEPEKKPAAAPAGGATSAPPDTLRLIVLIAFGLSGCASLAYEVLWTRALVYFLGLTTYAFTTMLTAFLVGIAVGSFLISRYADRFRNPLLWFAAAELLIALCALALTPTINVMYPISHWLGEWLGRGSWWSVVGARFMVAFILMLPATLCMGATMPLVIRFYTENLKVLGREVGQVYAANTVGAILGSAAAGFLLVPLFGVRLGISIVVGLNLLIAGTLFYVNPTGRVRAKRLLAGLSAAGLIGVILLADSTPLILSSVEFKGLQRRYELLYAHEGPDASLAVLEDKVNGERELSINGESTAFTIYQDMQVHKLLGHLPPLFHPAPQDFLVVGFGFGSTAYASTLYPGARVDCVELVKDEIETAPFFEQQNHGVIDYPNFNLIVGDGRDYIKLTEKTYDIISFNAIHPKISPNLYTLDFYRQCDRLLRDDGLIIAWMPPNAISEDEFWSLVGTFRAVFRHSSLWYVNPSHLLILGGRRPLSIDWQLLTERLQDTAISADLAETNLEDPCELLSNFVMTEDALEELVRATELNTDNNPLIEFSQVHAVTVNVNALRTIQRARESVYPYLHNFASEEERQTVRTTLVAYNDAKNWVIEGQLLAWSGMYDQAGATYRRALALRPENAHVRYLLGLIERRQEDLVKLVALNPRNMKAHKALADIYLEEGQLRQARNHFVKAVAIDPEYAAALHGLGVVHFQLEQPSRALSRFLEALRADPDLSAAHFYAGLCYWRRGNAPRAAEHFQHAVDSDPARAPNHYWLGLALEKLGRTAPARAAFQQALELDPDYAPARQALQKLAP